MDLAAKCPCLACARCGQVVVMREALLAERGVPTLKSSVFAYELAVLGVPTWCYSATQADGKRFDVLRVSEICVGRARVDGISAGRSRACGVLPFSAVGGDGEDGDIQANEVATECWFPGFAAQPVRCAGCNTSTRLLGWAFTPVEESSDREGSSLGFFGLIVTRLTERQATKDELRPSAMAMGAGSAAPTRGLRASTVRQTSNPAATAAVRGFGAMPLQLIPSAAEQRAPDSRGGSKPEASLAASCMAATSSQGGPTRAAPVYSRAALALSAASAAGPGWASVASVQLPAARLRSQDDDGASDGGTSCSSEEGRQAQDYFQCQRRLRRGGPAQVAQSGLRKSSRTAAGRGAEEELASKSLRSRLAPVSSNTVGLRRRPPVVMSALAPRRRR
eukprot:TRINITY_DN27310_c0_g1_i1.p1 TRINITY_DN27310_c0_g1~~TRINITY_DN27310_c0_g1_i1.p1  ORF type:complete len:392 (-),score=105.24 TRINITY_DN27310_c0_g1_i1:164-1339(-)